MVLKVGITDLSQINSHKGMLDKGDGEFLWQKEKKSITFENVESEVTIGYGYKGVIYIYEYNMCVYTHIHAL